MDVREAQFWLREANAANAERQLLAIRAAGFGYGGAESEAEQRLLLRHMRTAHKGTATMQREQDERTIATLDALRKRRK